MSAEFKIGHYYKRWTQPDKEMTICITELPCTGIVTKSKDDCFPVGKHSNTWYDYSFEEVILDDLFEDNEEELEKPNLTLEKNLYYRGFTNCPFEYIFLIGLGGDKGKKIYCEGAFKYIETSSWNATAFQEVSLTEMHEELKSYGVTPEFTQDLEPIGTFGKGDLITSKDNPYKEVVLMANEQSGIVVKSENKERIGTIFSTRPEWLSRDFIIAEDLEIKLVIKQ